MHLHRVLFAALLFALSAVAHAEITVVRYFRLGESDPGAAHGALGGARSTDSAGIDDLVLTGAPLYSADVANSVSALSLEFDGATQYATTGNWNNLTSNFGVEAWVKPVVQDGVRYIIYNGQSAQDGWGIIENPSTGKFGALFGGRAAFGEGDIVPGVWTHLAIVCTASVATFYVNGVASGSTTNLPNSATGFMAIATNAVTPARDIFGGKIDEVRIFTFAPGAFSLGDLLLSGPAIPPILNAKLVAGQDRLAWPTWDRGFGLQTSTSLLPGSWTSIYPPNEIDGVFSVSRTSLDPARFYRLKKPCGDIAPPMLPAGKFITLLSNGDTINITNPSSQIENAILGSDQARLDASAFVDPADCNGGANSLEFHWVITYPVVPPAVPSVYAVQGVVGYRKPVLEMAPNSLVNQPVPYAPNGLGVQFLLTVTSQLTGLSTSVSLQAQVVNSALTLNILNDCKQRVTICTHNECICTIAAALPTEEPH